MSGGSLRGLLVVLDTNVLVSGLAFPGSVPGEVVRAFQTGRLAVALSQHILDETFRALPRFKNVKRTPEEIRDVVQGLMSLAMMVLPSDVSDTELRDAADRPVLGTLLASNADYLVTGDKDLLVLADRYPIVRPAEFWARHG